MFNRWFFHVDSIIDVVDLVVYAVSCSLTGISRFIRGGVGNRLAHFLLAEFLAAFQRLTY